MFSWVDKVLATLLEPSMGLFGCLDTVECKYRVLSLVTLPSSCVHLSIKTMSVGDSLILTARSPLLALLSSLFSLGSIVSEQARALPKVDLDEGDASRGLRCLARRCVGATPCPCVSDSDVLARSVGACAPHRTVSPAAHRHKLRMTTPSTPSTIAACQIVDS